MLIRFCSYPVSLLQQNAPSVSRVHFAFLPFLLVHYIYYIYLYIITLVFLTLYNAPTQTALTCVTQNAFPQKGIFVNLSPKLSVCRPEFVRVRHRMPAIILPILFLCPLLSSPRNNSIPLQSVVGILYMIRFVLISSL